MKSAIILFAVLIIAFNALAAVHTVSGDGLADFTTVQAAINAAAVGDTILVNPISIYPGFTVDRRLIIMGAGIEPLLHKNTKIAGVVSITSAADGTELRSLWISAPAAGGFQSPTTAVLRIAANCQEVLVWRCFIENISPVANWMAGAFLGDSASCRFLQSAFLVTSDYGNTIAVSADSLVTIVLENCVFTRWRYTHYSTSATSGSFVEVRHCIHESFNGGNHALVGNFSGSIENSVTVNALINTSTPNFTANYTTANITPTAHFVNYVQYNAQNSDYRLQAGSSLINAGNPSSPFDLDGSQADQGVHGGQHPYVKNGAPDFPFVLEVEVPTSAPAGGVMNVFTRGRIGPGN